MEEIENISNEAGNIVYIILEKGVCVYTWKVICYRQLLTNRKRYYNSTEEDFHTAFPKMFSLCF